MLYHYGPSSKLHHDLGLGVGQGVGKEKGKQISSMAATSILNASQLTFWQH